MGCDGMNPCNRFALISARWRAEKNGNQAAPLIEAAKANRGVSVHHLIHSARISTNVGDMLARKYRHPVLFRH